jgi:hypothetical protein
MTNKKECQLCGEKHNYKSGMFTRHLHKCHDITLEEYVIKFEYNNIPPLCKCGCNKIPVFRRGKFKDYAENHFFYKERIKEYIKKNGIPKCKNPKCNNEVKFVRAKPNMYCHPTCKPGYWNQEKIKETVREKYGVENVFQISEIVKEIQSKVDHKENARKGVITKRNKYKNGAFDPNVMKKTMMNKYGVEHISQTEKFRREASKRMKNDNPMFDEEVVKKTSSTYIKRVRSGEIKLYRTRQFKDTDLYYQSSYEKEFLEICESLNILNHVKNGNTYKYINLDGKERNFLTDFSIFEDEIEIKSSWILEKQGGQEIFDIKRKVIEELNKEYIFILDKDYSDFYNYINQNENLK